MTLQELIIYVGKHVVFDEKKYPELVGTNDGQKFTFAIRHSALHYSKVAGKVAEIAESKDHGGDVDAPELKKAVWKSLVNALWLADKVGMTETEILDAIKKKYGD